jgi:arginase family enzyme
MDAHLDAKEPVGRHTSHDVVMRKLVENQVFGADEILCVGTTQIDEDEGDLEEDLRILDYAANEHRSVAVDSPVYLSFDIDVLAIKGTGYPDGRMSLSRCQELINSFDVRHSDLVEVAPPLCGDAVSTGRNVISILLEALGESY